MSLKRAGGGLERLQVDKQLLERRKKLDEIVNLKTRYEKEQQKINSSLTIKKHQLNAIKKVCVCGDWRARGVGR